MQKKVTLNKKLKPFISNPQRYNVAFGGRGSSKSWTIARMLLLFAMQKSTRVLCVREIQNSIKDSSHKLLSDQIKLLGLIGFTVTQDTIKHENGSEFIFKGLYTNLTSIKSLEGVDMCWIEEAESISAQSWEVLDPTIRKENSRIFISFNPRYETDIIYKTFILNPPPNANVIKINWNDNKYFTQALEEQRKTMQQNNPDLYLHIWEGNIKQNTNELIFANKWEIRDFESPNYLSTHYYYGADWGFSNDPNTLIRCFIQNKSLFIDYELCDRPYNDKKLTSTELTNLPLFWDKMPLVRQHTVTADSARPETINYMINSGFVVKSSVKGKGSVEDGIEFLRSFEKIVVHSRCVNTIFELGNYKYKVDKRSGQITNQIIDDNNHMIDALRYALESCMKNKVIDYKSIL